MSKSIKHEELRTKKMMSEGSPVLTAYFNESTLDEMRGENEWIAVKAMISEGGLGAEMYYNNDQKIANLDVELNHL